jgi:Protein of unknown function (DUF3303)
MLFMVIERFKDRDPIPIYARLQERGRVMPDGLRYVDSWIEANFDRCFQLMECDDPLLLQRWVLQWRDLMEFEVVSVSPSEAIRELFSSVSKSRAVTGTSSEALQ